MQVVPWIFGIPHATGFPAFVILAGLFAHVFAVGSVAWRIAFFCALCMSGAAWLVARIVREIDGDPWIGAAAGCIFAFGHVAWTRGTRAEVHAAALFFALLTICAFLRWFRFSRTSDLAAAFAAWGIGIAVHPIVVLLLPALMVLTAARRRNIRLRHAAVAALALAAGLSLYAYLPLRSAVVDAARLDPTTRLGLPAGQAFWDTDDPRTLSGFIRLVSGTQFNAGGGLAAMFSPPAYVDRGPSYVQTLWREMTPLALVFALGGAYALLRTSWPPGIALLLAVAVPTAFAFGYSIEADINRYYLLSFAVAAALCGYGASRLAQALPPLRMTTTSVLYVLALVLLIVNRPVFGQRTAPGAEAVLTTVLKNTPPNAVLLSSWTGATPLAYGAYVQRRLGRRIVVSTWLSDVSSRVPGWTKRRPVYVVGELFGAVAGYRLATIPGDPVLYHLVKK